MLPAGDHAITLTATDNDPEAADRDHRQGRPQHHDDRGQSGTRSRNPEQRRPPATGDTDREHDRERLHSLNGAGQERSEEQEDAAHSAST